MLTQDEFKARVETCIDQYGFTPTEFGKAALRDPTFVFELRRGRRCNLETVNRVLSFIRKAKGSKRRSAA